MCSREEHVVIRMKICASFDSLSHPTISDPVVGILGKENLRHLNRPALTQFKAVLSRLLLQAIS